MSAPSLHVIRSMYASREVESHGGEGHERAARRSAALAEFDAWLDHIKRTARSDGYEHGHEIGYEAGWDIGYEAGREGVMSQMGDQS